MREEIDSSLIGPSQASLFRSTDQIKNDIVELLNLNDEVNAEDIEVIVDENGIVTLKGRVSDETAKEEAEQTAIEVLGVMGVRNELVVAR